MVVVRTRENVAEFDTYLHDELDLMREAASQLRRYFVDSKKLMIPEMYWDLCHTNVIVMEKMDGISIGRTQIYALLVLISKIPCR